jgi:large subunit ribosomal protein L4
MQLAKAWRTRVKHRGDVPAAPASSTNRRGPAARGGATSSRRCCGAAALFSGRTAGYTTGPEKGRRLALKMALSSKLQENALVVLDGFDLSEIKTRRFVSALKALNLKSALIVTEAQNDYLERSSRNVPKVKVLRSEGLNVYDVLKYDTLVLLQPAIKVIEGRLIS